MGGFEYSGSLVGSAPIVSTRQVGETCYTGQLLMWGSCAAVANAPGDVCVLDIADQSREDDHPVAGICTGVHTLNDAGYSGTTGYGDTATYDTTQAAQVANDPVGMTLIELTLAIPHVTLIKGSYYNAAYGTAITELVENTGSAGGTTVTHSQTAIDIEDDFGVCYCRQGANRGHYRAMQTPGTGAQVMGVAFPYAIAVGDVFVTAPGVPGICGLNIGTTANFIDAAKPINGDVDYYTVYVHQQNLEESGKEFVVFAFATQAFGVAGWIA